LSELSTGQARPIPFARRGGDDTTMNIKAMAQMAQQGGLITRSQARDCGMTTLDIKHAIRAKHWIIVRRGVYLDARIWAEADTYVDRHRFRTRAALLAMQRGWVVSHDSAAYELKLEIITPPDPHVHITREGSTGAWTRSHVKHHLAGFHQEQVVEVNGLRVLDLARTAVDIAREHGPPYGEVACDSAMRLGVTRKELDEALVPMAYWPHVRTAREAAAFADPGAQSVAETLGRLLVVEALGDQDLETQFPVALPNGKVVWGDIRVGCHVFEVHGKAKYIPIAEGGLADIHPTERAWNDKLRERLMHREGIGTSSIIVADYWNPDRAAVLKRLRAEYADSVALFGAELPRHLRRNADALRRGRPA
jgi:hypothetical protein